MTRLLKDSIGGNCRTVMISNISPSSLTYEDTYNTLRYADRAKKIKINLKKNILSVDFQVGQYAKIVEDLKSQLQDVKQKLSSLEEENLALKTQLELDDSEKAAKPSANLVEIHEELEVLKAHVSELENRQKDYDELQLRLAKFEENQVATVAEVVDPETPEKMLVYLRALTTYQQSKSTVRLLMVKRENYQKNLIRSALLNPSSDYDETQTKLFKCVKDLSRKVSRQVKKNEGQRALLEGLERPPENDEFKQKCQNVTQRIQLEHACKLAENMFHEQSKTDDLMCQVISQLKSFYMSSYGSQSQEMNANFKSLVTKLQCSTVQFRDYNIIETNEDSQFDRLGAFYGSIVDLDQTMVDNDENNYIATKGNETILMSDVQ